MFALGLLAGFILCFLLLAKPLAAQAPTTENEDLFSDDITITNNALQNKLYLPNVLPKPPVYRRSQSPVSDCSSYKETVLKYFGEYTETALFVASKESGCRNIRGARNGDGSYDYCIFQINNEPKALEIETCVRRAWEKFVDGRFGDHNFSAWYAVCEKEKTKKNPLPYPVPKYENIKCN